MIDTTITLNADTRYTLYYTGQARGNNDQLLVVVDPSTPPTPAASTLYQFAVAPTGAAATSYAASPNVPGAAAPPGATYGAQPGVRIPGSVLTAVLTGAPTAGSPAATAANQAVATRVVVLVDKVLNP